MTTEQLDEEKRIEERDDTVDEFIDVVEDAKQHQHPTVENAVSGYVEQPEKRDGSIHVTVHVPAYDQEVETEVADVDGSLNRSSFLYGLLDDFEDIAKLPTENPIPLKQKKYNSDSFKLVEPDEDGEEEENASESGPTLTVSNNRKNDTVELSESTVEFTSVLLLISAFGFGIAALAVAHLGLYILAVATCAISMICSLAGLRLEPYLQ